ncbi:MAG: SusD/RagB family nutrient-binding outer membrane lipoprotein [Saprospiraceae bacterium]|nr:SusD/RagB family nutrient-binding outer membrane lipoprotein [Saprospiraceae bacterium]
MKSIFLKFCMIASFIVMVDSCSKDALADLNVDPNAVTDIDMQYLFTLGTLRVGGEYENTRALMLYAAPMIQHTASTAGYFSGDKYFYNSGYSGAYMERQFTDVIRLLSQVISKTNGDAKQANLNAAATLVRSFNMHRMTDLYGDIPYTQAGYGLENQENWFPKYENQKDVYTALVKDVKAARDKLNAAGGSLGKQDPIYGGDIAKWKKFANSLLMRIGMRMQKKDEATGKAVFTEAFTSGGITSNADNGTIKYLAGPQGVNRNGLNDGYWNTYKYSNDCKLSKTFVDWMVTNKDPRLMIVSGGTGTPADDKTWNVDPAAQKGMPNGYTSANIKPVLSAADAAAFDKDGNRIFSMLNLKYLDWQDPYILITAAETELLCAEAAVRGWITTNAETHFNNGVTAAINQWTAFDPSFARSAADVTTYISGRKFAAANTADRLKLISEEYWAATWLDDIEAWSNWRRTGIPALVPTKDPNREEANEIPRRLRYWESEAGSNPANYKTAVDRMGGDKFMTKMWWDGGN